MAERESEKYPIPVGVDDGCTFEDIDGRLWPERFKNIHEFSEGLAGVKLDVELDDEWTFVDENHKLWPERFKFVFSFSEGLAGVKLDYDKYTFVDKNHKLWTERFKNIWCKFNKGLAKVELNDGSSKFVNRYHQIFDTEELGRKCGTLIEKPESILEWKTEDFKDEEFIKKCVETIKGSLIEKIEQKDEVDDDYVKYCQELLTGVKDKIEAEKEKIVQEEKNRQEAIKLIKDFNL